LRTESNAIVAVSENKWLCARGRKAAVKFEIVSEVLKNGRGGEI
jgi:hypothetical protein